MREARIFDIRSAEAEQPFELKRVSLFCTMLFHLRLDRCGALVEKGWAPTSEEVAARPSWAQFRPGKRKMRATPPSASVHL